VAALVFVFQRFLLDPLSEQSKKLGRITFYLHYYRWAYNSPLDPRKAPEGTEQRYREAADALRKLGSSLAEASESIRLYWLWRLLRMTLDRKSIDAATGLLTRMSNSLFVSGQEQYMEQAKQNWADADEIIQVLGLRR
jgi:hypothetical protein